MLISIESILYILFLEKYFFLKFYQYSPYYDLFRENRELLHKYYAEIARERMHCDDHHLIEKQKALLPTFENEEDAELKIDVGVDEDEEL